jgi:hypothetical protein
MVLFVVGPIYAYTPVEIKYNEYTVVTQGKDAEEKLEELKRKVRDCDEEDEKREYTMVKVNTPQDVEEVKRKGILYSDIRSGKYINHPAQSVKKRKQTSLNTDDEAGEKKVNVDYDENWCRQKCQGMLSLIRAQQKEKEKEKEKESKEHTADSKELTFVAPTAPASVHGQCVLVAHKSGWAWAELSPKFIRIENNTTTSRYLHLPVDVDASLDSCCHFYAGWLALTAYMTKVLSSAEVQYRTNSYQEPTVTVHNYELIIAESYKDYIKFAEKLSEYDTRDPNQQRLHSTLKLLQYRRLAIQHPYLRIKWQFKYTNGIHTNLSRYVRNHLLWVVKNNSNSPSNSLKRIKNESTTPTTGVVVATVKAPLYWEKRARQTAINFFHFHTQFDNLRTISELLIQIKQINTKKLDIPFAVLDQKNKGKIKVDQHKVHQLQLSVTDSEKRVYFLQFATQFHQYPQSICMYYLTTILRWLRPRIKPSCKIKIRCPFSEIIIKTQDNIRNSKNLYIYQILFSNNSSDKANLIDVIRMQQEINEFDENTIQILT